ncbi:MAG: hypothetical protein KJ767_02280 [Nanoarchaeota archaeon]|nr:hypothetical protein [Nanoarchaeota archaeon]
MEQTKKNASVGKEDAEVCKRIAEEGIMEFKIKIEDLSFGAGNAEQESEILEKAFVETAEFKDILTGRFNVVIGNKGAGKSALYDALIRARKPNVFIVPISSMTGTVEYERIFNRENLAEMDTDNFREYWKRYIALRTAYAIKNYQAKGEASSEFDELETEFEKMGFSKTLMIKAGMIAPEISEETFRMLLEIIRDATVDYSKLLSLTDRLAKKWGIQIWFVMDRLDEIVISNSSAQKKAVEALFVTLKDLSVYKNLKPIIFLREDIYNNLEYAHVDHFHSVTRNIRWDREQLLLMLVKRILSLSEINSEEIEQDSAEDTFFKVFENKIPNSRAGNCFDWMCNHLMDGRDITLPRDLILLANKSRDDQASKKYNVSTGEIISGKAIVKAHTNVAEIKLKDTERIYPEIKELIPSFSNELVKEEYGWIKRKSFQELFKDRDEKEIENIIKRLIDSGFIRPENRTNPLSSPRFEIPYVYKTALGIKSTGRKAQHKAE